MIDIGAVRFGQNGLVAVVAQDAADGRVLMLGYSDAEAIAATQATGELHFHSRSRDRLWRKGETSGGVLRVVDLALDCDADAILATVEPVRPTCHRGTRSCFDREGADREGADREGADPEGADPEGAPATASGPQGRSSQGFAWLDELWRTIASRVAERPPGSYTATLLDGGVDAVGRKVTEEATELLLAAKDDAAAEASGRPRADTRAALKGEAADLLYHALVLLAERDLPPSDVIGVLRQRHHP